MKDWEVRPKGAGDASVSPCGETRLAPQVISLRCDVAHVARCEVHLRCDEESALPTDLSERLRRRFKNPSP